jgi:hypothetical protein
MKNFEGLSGISATYPLPFPIAETPVLGMPFYAKDLCLFLISDAKIILFSEPADKRQGSRQKSELVSHWRGVLHLFK